MLTDGRFMAAARDLTYAVRVLSSRRERKASWFSVAILGVAIGTTLVVFTIAFAVLFRSFPYPESSRLMSTRIVREAEDGSNESVGVPNFRLFSAWRDGGVAFEMLGAYQTADQTFTAPNLATIRVPTVASTAAVFNLLAGVPAVGRTLVMNDDRLGAGNVVILSHAFWARHYGADPGVVGRSVVLGDQSYEVVGIMRPSFRIPLSIPENRKHEAEVWINLSSRITGSRAPQDVPVEVIGRIPPGATPTQVASQLSSHNPLIDSAVTDQARTLVIPLKEVVTAQVRQPILVLLSAVALLLVVAATNVANLRLAGSIHGSRDMALRLALGAPRITIIGRLFAESAVITLLGACAGFVFAYWVTPLVVTLGDRHLPEIGAIGLDTTSLWAGVGISLVIAIVITLGPATYALSVPSTAALKGRGDSPREGRIRMVLSDSLVVAQIGLTLTLVAAAALLTRSVYNLTDRTRGYEPEGLALAALRLPSADFSTTESQEAFVQQLVDLSRGIPGVEEVAVATGGPIIGGVSGEVVARDRVMRMSTWSVSPGFFDVLEIPLLSGRMLQDAEESNAVVLDAHAADQLFGTQQVLGAHVEWLGGVRSGVVVGVVANINEYYVDNRGARFRSTEPHVYTKYGNDPRPFLRLWLRSHVNFEQLEPEVRGAVQSISSSVALDQFTSVAQLISDTSNRETFITTLVAILGAISLLLAAGGIHAIVADVTARRAHEIGIRIALGARPQAVVRFVVRRAMVVAGIGFVAGLAGIFAIKTSLASILVDVSSLDPIMILSAAGTIAIMAALASALPARKATRTNPFRVINTE